MAGLSPIVSNLMPVINTVSGLFDSGSSPRAQQARDQQLAYDQQQAIAQQQAQLQARQQQEQDQLRASQQADLAAAQADAQTKASQLAAQADAAEQKRRDALKQAMARTRANLAARGGGAEDGSGQALLLGLVDANGQDSQSDQTTLQLRTQALNQQLQDRYQTNLLEQTQLADRQRLRMLSAFD